MNQSSLPVKRFQCSNCEQIIETTQGIKPESPRAGQWPTIHGLDLPSLVESRGPNRGGRGS